MKIGKADVERLTDTAERASVWLESMGYAPAVADFDKVQELLSRHKPHKKDDTAFAMRHSVIRKMQKRWLEGLMKFYGRVAVPVTELKGVDIVALQDLVEDVTEDYQFLEWFVIDSLNKDNLDEEDHREADEAFAEEERQYRESQKRKKRK